MLRILILTLLLSGCSALGLLKTLGGSTPAVAVDTELVVGDKQEEISVLGQEAETITNNNEANMFLIIMACVGWILPSPQEIVRLIKEYKSGVNS